jgi:hypothetical protein
MRMVIGPWLDDPLDRAAEGLVALVEQLGVLLVRHDLVAVAVDQQQRDLRLRQRSQVVHRVGLVGQRLLVILEAKCLEHLVPFGCGPWPRAEALELPTRPALEVAHAVVEVDGERLLGVRRCPGHAVQGATTEADKRRLGVQPIVLDQHVVELLPLGHRLGSAEEVRDAHVGQVPAGLEQVDVGVGEGPEELAAPGPGPPWQGLGWLDNQHIDTVHFEVMTVEAVPHGHLASERPGCCRCHGRGK